MVRGRGNLEQVDQIAVENARLIEGTVIKIFRQTRTAQVRLDGSSQYINVVLGHIDPSLVSNAGSRVLLYRTSGAIYALSAMPGQFIQSSPGVTLGDRWGGTELTIFNSRICGTQTYDVAGIDSLGNIRGSNVAALGSVVAQGNVVSYGNTISYGDVVSIENMRYCGDLMPVRGEDIYTGFIPVPIQEPLTHDSFNGDSFSTVGSHTKIENTGWSTAIPSSARALSIMIATRDSGSAANASLFFDLFSTATAISPALICYCGGVADDAFTGVAGFVPCTEGDIWYRCTASGSNTLDVWLWCTGYFL